MSTTQRVFRVFISSTFSDLVAERNALQERVFPRLQEFCRQREARFQAVDLRWGVSEEAGHDQQTMNICLEELRRCQDTTPRPNFIILLGQRYGWRPLPPQIVAAELENILAVLPMEPQQRLLHWYRRDDNAVPPEYCLQARKGEWENQDLWSPEEAVLRSFLLEGMEKVLPPDDPERVKYEAAATHQEIMAGALNATGPEQKVFAYLRTIEGLPRDERARRFLDLDAQGRPEEEAAQRLEQLKDELRRALPAQQVYEYAARYFDQGPTDDHLGPFCERVERDLREVIEAEMQTLEQKSALAQEVDAHLAFGKERGETFLGRDDLLQRIVAYLEGAEPRPLVLHGLSGAGKTALMSKAVLERLNPNGQEQVIYRFLGATPASSDLRSLLDGLCRQIAEQYEDERPIPQEMRELVKDLPERMAQATADRPLVVFLDALDQLSANDSARTLYWLPRELPAHVRLVVSVLEGEGLAAECSRVARRIFPEECHVTVGPLSAQAGAALLDVWLGKAGRTLTAEQRHEVLTKFAGCPRPLYLKLAFEEARRWKSYDGLPCGVDDIPGLSKDISGVLNDLFARLEQPSHHGRMMVQRALGYLAAARYGLTEEELLGVLSADTEFMADFIDRSPTESAKRARGEKVLGRVPIVVWSRLYHDLKPYLTEREADQTVQLSFYHRQVAEAVAERYLQATEKSRAHQALAAYFGGQESWIGPERATAAPNRRKASELVHQQLQAGMWDLVEGTLVGEKALPFLEAKAEAGQLFDLANDYSNAVKAVPREREEQPFLRLLDQALRTDLHFIARHPTTLFQCLWNSCWWYDSSQAVKHYDQPESGWAKQGPPWQREGAKLSALLDDWRLQKEAAQPGFVWLRSLRPPPLALGSAQVACLRTHEASVNGVAFAPDGHRVASGSDDGTVRLWDAVSGAEVGCLRGHEGSVRSVAYSPDGCFLASGSADKTVRLWDAASGAELACLHGHDGWVDSIAFSPDGHHLASAGGDDRTVRLWDIDYGVELACLRGHELGVRSVAFSPDSRRFASAGGDRTVRLWELDGCGEVACLREHTGPVSGVAFSPDGRHLASASDDWTVRLWDAASGAEVAFLHGHESHVTGVTFSPDGRWLATSSWDNTVRIWDAASGVELACLRGHEEWVNNVAFSADGRRIASASSDGTVRVWDTDSGPELAWLHGHGPGESVESLAFSRDGRRLVSSTSHTVRLWDAAIGTELVCHRGHEEDVLRSAVFSPDGRLLAGGSVYKTVRLWDAESGAELTCLRGHENLVSSVAFSSDGRRLASGSADHTVRLWDTVSGAELACLRGHEEDVLSVALSPDSRHIASASGDMTPIWDADGRRVHTGTWDNTVRVWDANSRAQLDCLRGHEGSVRKVAFSPDGHRLASASDDGTVRVWDVETSACLEVLQGRGDPVAIAAGPPCFPFRALGRSLETVVEWSTASTWFPIALQHITTHPSGRTWAGSIGNYLCLFTLEGDAIGSVQNCQSIHR